MSTENVNQPPDTPTTPQTKTRRPRKLLSPTHSPQSQHEGGVAIPATNTTEPSTEETAKAAPRRRRPRKLNRQQDSSATAATGPKDPPGAPTTTDDAPDPVSSVSTEITALKTRVQSLESQVSELYQKPASPAPRPARRRGRGNSSRTQTAATESAGTSESKDQHPTQGEDTVASEQQQTLVQGEEEYGSSPNTALVVRNEPVEEVLEEEIPRTHDPAVESTRNGALTKPLELSGTYKIPLPATLSLDDVRNIRSGISSANTIARKLMETSRAASNNSREQQSQEAVEESASPTKQSWGAWLGSHSMSVVQLMSKIEANAAVEASTRSTSSSPHAPTAKAKAKTANRPRRAASAGQCR